MSKKASGEDDVSETNRTEDSKKALPDIETMEGRAEVMKRASKGDESIRTQVKQLLDQDQRNGGTLLEAYGNYFRHTAIELTKGAAGDNLLIRESLLRKINAIRDDLAGPNPTPLERLLCERVALCAYDASEMDRRFCDQSGIGFNLAGWREARRDRAHKRFLAACKTLATVRRLGGPAVQVNVAQQVHVNDPISKLPSR